MTSINTNSIINTVKTSLTSSNAPCAFTKVEFSGEGDYTATASNILVLPDYFRYLDLIEKFGQKLIEGRADLDSPKITITKIDLTTHIEPTTYVPTYTLRIKFSISAKNGWETLGCGE